MNGFRKEHGTPMYGPNLRAVNVSMKRREETKTISGHDPAGEAVVGKRVNLHPPRRYFDTSDFVIAIDELLEQVRQRLAPALFVNATQQVEPPPRKDGQPGKFAVGFVGRHLRPHFYD